MLVYPNFNPIAFELGPLKVHWYGIMYLVGFISTWLLGVYRSKKPWSPINSEQVTDALFYGALGVIVGGRLGYVLFYDLSFYFHNPLQVFAIWDGGMSFHGGLIGVIISQWFYSHKLKLSLFDLTDFFAPMCPLGLAAGRLGNFINGELWGRVTDSPFGMVFPTGGPLPRYPSQLIELFLEGFVLFIILWSVSLKPRPKMFVSSLFLIFYGLFRFLVEFFREPDAQLGYLAWGWLTRGQELCVPMIVFGIALLVLCLRSRAKL